MAALREMMRQNRQKFEDFRQMIVEAFEGLDIEYKSIRKDSPKQVKDVVMRAMMQKCGGFKATSVYGALVDHFELVGDGKTTSNIP